jgi:superfamily II DNA or RNA helicase
MTAATIAPVDRLAAVRARFAESLDVTCVEPTLGAIVLRPAQLEAARRVRSLLRRAGGCLLADDVGTGKTYVALAIAREWQRPLIVLPASLRSTWESAMRRAAVTCATVTHESLSRGTRPAEAFDGVVVDESHRFRPTSRRHAALARLSWRGPLLLLSATPLQNRARELAAQLALFLGEMAYGLEPAVLTRWIVRATVDPSDTLPIVAPPRWLQPDVDDGDVLEALLALPPPPRAADAGDGGALLLLSLVRAWASSRAALRATIRRRRRTLTALEQCHAEGRLPSRRELASWQGEDAVQLGFPTLLASASDDRLTADRLARALDAERVALERLVTTIARGADPDEARVEALRDIRARHRDAAVLAFSESASTVRAYFAAMRADVGVGMLTASEARIASGRLARDALLARFAPRAQGAAEPHARERVTLLLATDLLSEGVNLQDAAAVVHLDLPWNPARLAQRLGRVRRPGGPREVASYLMAPPARAALLLRAETRLRDKLAQAERTIGRGLDVLPRLTAGGHRDIGASAHEADEGARPTLAVAELRSDIDRALARWRRATRGDGRVRDGERDELEGRQPVIAAISSQARGWLAVLNDGRLVAAIEECGHVTDEVSVVARVLRLVDVEHVQPVAVDTDASTSARRDLARWIAADWTRHVCALDVSASPLRRRLLRHLETTVREAPRHRRPQVLRIARILRDAIERPLPLGIERLITTLIDDGPSAAHAGPPDDVSGSVVTAHSIDWLTRAVALLSSRYAQRDSAPSTQLPSSVAIILLQRAREQCESGSALPGTRAERKGE